MKIYLKAGTEFDWLDVITKMSGYFHATVDLLLLIEDSLLPASGDDYGDNYIEIVKSLMPLLVSVSYKLDKLARIVDKIYKNQLQTDEAIMEAGTARSRITCKRNQLLPTIQVCRTFRRRLKSE